MFRKQVGWVATLAVALCASQAWAQEDGERRGDGRRDGDRGSFRFPNPLLDALDTDKNGELSTAEINEAAKTLKTLDKNKDGKVAADELRPPRPQFRTFNSEEFVTRIMEADANKDGKISKAEAPERMREGFDNLDTNKDQHLDKSEIEAMVQRFGQGRRGRDRDGDRDRGGDRNERRPAEQVEPNEVDL